MTSQESEMKMKQKKQLKFKEDEKDSSNISPPKDTQQSQTNQNGAETDGEEKVEKMTSGLNTDPSDKNNASESEEAKEDPQNLSDVETPRVDISGLKLDSAQKEKTSFL